MKNNILVITFLLLVQVIFAQQHPRADRKGQADRVKSLWTAYLTQELELSPEESAKFWPIYNEFKEKERQIRKSMAQKPAKPIHEMSDAEIDAIALQRLNNQEKIIALKKEYYPKYKTAIPARKIIRIEKIEREFKKMLVKKIQERRSERSNR